MKEIKELHSLDMKYAEGGKVPAIEALMKTISEKIAPEVEAHFKENGLDGLIGQMGWTHPSGPYFSKGATQQALEDLHSHATETGEVLPRLVNISQGLAEAGGTPRSRGAVNKLLAHLATGPDDDIDTLDELADHNFKHLTRAYGKQPVMTSNLRGPLALPPGRDLNAIDLGNGMWRMNPSGDVVDSAEKSRRLNLPIRKASGGSIDAPLPDAISGPTGGGVVYDQLMSHMAANPSSHPVLQAHALALLRANLNAAHALNSLTGYGEGIPQGSGLTMMRALNQALGGGHQGMTFQMLADQLANSGDANKIQEIAPAAMQAAAFAVPGSGNG